MRTSADEIGIGKDSVREILMDQLHMREVCSVWIPHILSDANKVDRVQCAATLVELMDFLSKEDCLKYWAMEDETWMLYSSKRTKQENRAWQARGD